MQRIVDIPTSIVLPREEVVLSALGYRRNREPDPRTRELLEAAAELYRDLVRPKGLYAQSDPAAFARIYEGEGRNEPVSPLQDIYPRASCLALFAVTAGGPVSVRIQELFAEREFALGAVLDATASEGAELAGEYLERQYLQGLRDEGAADSTTSILRYSPGYCGWDLTGQRALFAALRPEQIGIRLTESCLMEPVKSISGAMVCGPVEIHDFDNDYRFCEQCRTKGCRTRLKDLRRAAQ